MNKNDVLKKVAGAVLFAGAYALMIRVENRGKEHLTKQPDGTYK